eukprot:jgi/Mesvir1/10504/Mv14927-RA.1
MVTQVPLFEKPLDFSNAAKYFFPVHSDPWKKLACIEHMQQELGKWRQANPASWTSMYMVDGEEGGGRSRKRRLQGTRALGRLNRLRTYWDQKCATAEVELARRGQPAEQRLPGEAVHAQAAEVCAGQPAQGGQADGTGHVVPPPPSIVAMAVGMLEAACASVPWLAAADEGVAHVEGWFREDSPASIELVQAKALSLAEQALREASRGLRGHRAARGTAGALLALPAPSTPRVGSSGDASGDSRVEGGLESDRGDAHGEGADSVAGRVATAPAGGEGMPTGVPADGDGEGAAGVAGRAATAPAADVETACEGGDGRGEGSADGTRRAGVVGGRGDAVRVADMAQSEGDMAAAAGDGDGGSYGPGCDNSISDGPLASPRSPGYPDSPHGTGGRGRGEGAAGEGGGASPHEQAGTAPFTPVSVQSSTDSDVSFVGCDDCPRFDAILAARGGRPLGPITEPLTRHKSIDTWVNVAVGVVVALLSSCQLDGAPGLQWLHATEYGGRKHGAGCRVGLRLLQCICALADPRMTIKARDETRDELRAALQAQGRLDPEGGEGKESPEDALRLLMRHVQGCHVRGSFRCWSLGSSRRVGAPFAMGVSDGAPRDVGDRIRYVCSRRIGRHGGHLANGTYANCYMEHVFDGKPAWVLCADIREYDGPGVPAELDVRAKLRGQGLDGQTTVHTLTLRLCVLYRRTSRRDHFTVLQPADPAVWDGEWVEVDGLLADYGEQGGRSRVRPVGALATLLPVVAGDARGVGYKVVRCVPDAAA